MRLRTAPSWAAVAGDMLRKEDPERYAAWVARIEAEDAARAQEAFAHALALPPAAAAAAGAVPAAPTPSGPGADVPRAGPTSYV